MPFPEPGGPNRAMLIMEGAWKGAQAKEYFPKWGRRMGQSEGSTKAAYTQKFSPQRGGTAGGRTVSSKRNARRARVGRQFFTFVIYHGKATWMGHRSIAALFTHPDLYFRYSLGRDFLYEPSKQSPEEESSKYRTMFERATQRAYHEGRQEGMQQGIQHIAKQMRAKGMEKSLISERTNLSLGDINAL